jgi:hypothetical protein
VTEVARERAKLLIPPETPALLVAAIQSYWRVWPEQRDKVLAEYEAELQQLRAAGLDVDSGDPDALWPVAVEIERQNVARGRPTPLLSNMFFFDDRYGGPLGFALIGEDWEDREPRLRSMLEVATRDELREVAEASDDELRRRPPVRVWVRSDLGELGVGIIGETNGVGLRDFSRLPAARDLVGLNDDAPSVARRSAYRRFANEFWALLGPDARGAQPAAAPIKRTQTRSLRQVPMAILSLITSPTSLPARAMISAIDNRARLRLDESGDPSYEYVQRTSQEKVRVTFRRDALPSTDKTIAAAAGVDAFLKWVSKAPEITTDVLILSLDLYHRQRDAEGKAFITSDYILRQRGIQPKKKRDGTGLKAYSAGWKADDLREVSEAMTALRSMTLRLIDVQSATANGKKRGPKARITLDSQAIAITDHTELTVEGKPVAGGWRYTPGSWADLFPFDQQFASLGVGLIRYNPYKEKWERRLGIYAALHLRLAGMTPVTRTIHQVFEHTNLAEEVETTYRAYPGKALARLRKALNRVVADNHLGGWSIDGHSGQQLDAYLARTLPPRDWWKRFERMMLTFQAPTDGPLFDALPSEASDDF